MDHCLLFVMQGYFEFRLCEHNNPFKNITQECLDQHLLVLDDTGSVRYTVPDGAYSTKLDINLRLRLPQGLTCVACVFQWKYNAGNSWGKDPVTGNECVGCGPQEQFYGCADVAIGHKEMQIGLVPKRYPWYLQDPDSEWHYGVAYVSSDTAAISGAARTLAEGRGVSEVALFTMLFALCVRRLQLIAIG